MALIIYALMDQYLMSSNHSNKALAEESGLYLPKISKDGSIITNFGDGVEHTLETKASQNLSHIPCILDD